MLARMWRRGNTCALLMAMEIGAAAVENSVGVPKKLKKKKKNGTCDPAIWLLGIYLKKKKTLTGQDTCIPTYSLQYYLQYYKSWKQSKCPLTDE